MQRTKLSDYDSIRLIEKPALKMKGRNLQDSWLSGIVIPKSEVKR